MKLGVVLAGAVVLASAVGHAEGVDPADLPPLPPAADDETTSSATVLAASSAEEDVVVGAAKREQSLGNVASAVTVVSADRIRRFGYRTVGEAIAGVAGMYLVDNRDTYSIGIRGLNIPGDFNTRILVLVDGASINEAWGSFAGIGFDNFVAIDDISRIEVIRGPVSSVYGANAFFGIVNIVTRGASETPRAWARTSINSTNGSITSAGFAAGNVHEQVRGTVQVMDRFGDTSFVPDVGSDLRGDASNQVMASLVGSYNGSFGQVRAVRYRRDSPFAPFNGDPTAADPYQLYDEQLLIEGGHTEELSKRVTVTGRAYANIYQFVDHIVQEAAPKFDDYGDATTVGAEVRGRAELIVPQRLGITAGAETNYNRTSSHSYQELPDGTEDPTITTTVPKNFNIEGLYTEFDGQPTPFLGFTGGLRYDRNSVVDTHVSPRAALFLSKAERYGLKLLYAEGFRNPSAFEKFFYDNSSFTQPPASLHAETIRSGEAVAWAKPYPGLSTRISGFYWDARDIVTAETIANPIPDPMNPGATIQQFQNATRIVSEGIEVEASYRNSRGWYGFAGGAYSRVGAVDSNTMSNTVQFGNVPDAPALTGSIGISTPKLYGYAHVSTELNYVGERPVRLDANDNMLPDAPAWLGWNATVYAPNVRGFDITLGLRNIIGHREQVITPGDYDRSGATNVVIPTVPGEGREIYVKVGYSY